MDNDVGYPTGYIKVEINCEVAKLQIALNNLSNRQGLKYQLYGIKKDDKHLIYTAICDIPNENGRADVKISADIYRIGSSKLTLEDINIFAIIIQLPNRTPSIKCPLVAYTRGEVIWKNEFEALVLNKELLTSNDTIAKNVKLNNTKSDIVSESINEIGKINGVADSDKDNKTEQLPNILAEIGSFQDIGGETEVSEYIENKETEVSFESKNGEINVLLESENGEINVSKDNGIFICDDVKDKENDTSNIVKNGKKDASEALEHNETAIAEKAENSGIDILDNIENSEYAVSGNIENIKDNLFKDMQTDKVEELEYQDNFEQAFDYLEGMPLQKDVGLYTDKKSNISEKFESAITNIYNKHKSTVIEQENTPEVGLVDNDILSSVQKNFNDISLIEIDVDKAKNELNMPRLKEELDKSFESFNPFKMNSKNFKWWKINSPGYLNNILFRHNIKTYLLFNPKVMLAHYKYRYIIFGIRNDKHLGKEYLICGVPGVYSIDENPFGNMGNWAQIEGYKPKYGAFGYWIILIDPRTGKLMKVK